MRGFEGPVPDLIISVPGLRENVSGLRGPLSGLRGHARPGRTHAKPEGLSHAWEQGCGCGVGVSNFWPESKLESESEKCCPFRLRLKCAGDSMGYVFGWSIKKNHFQIIL